MVIRAGRKVWRYVASSSKSRRRSTPAENICPAPMRTTARVGELLRAVNWVVSASQNSTSRALALPWAIWSRVISPCWVMSIIALAFYHSHVSHDAATGGLHGPGYLGRLQSILCLPQQLQ